MSHDGCDCDCDDGLGCLRRCDCDDGLCVAAALLEKIKLQNSNILILIKALYL